MKWTCGTHGVYCVEGLNGVNSGHVGESGTAA